MRKRYSNIICPYCKEKCNRWMKLKLHIQLTHKGLEVPEWILNEIKH
jgi:hypothetical protein